MFKKTYLSLASAAISTALLMGCGSSSSSSSHHSSINSANFAVVNTVDAAFTDSQLSYVDLTQEQLSAKDSNLSTGNSDYTISAFGKYFYLIGRNGIDQISKFSADKPNAAIEVFSTLDDADDSTSNPYDLIFASDDKAYLIRYGSDKLWIVNPEATTQVGFKIDEIDLSAYNTTDNNPNMAAGVIANGKLYIAMQRLEGYDATVNDSYIAVIDTATDNEIDTRAEGSTEPFKGIKLETRNPGKIINKDGLLLVQSIGSYNTDTYIGGVEKINNDYSTTVLIDDNESTGLISDLTVVDAEKAYIAQYLGWGDNQLCSFNPTADNVQESVDCSIADTTAIKGTNISGLTISPSGDLWVSITDAASPRIEVIDPETNNIEQTIDQFAYNPGKVVFVQK